MSRAAIGLGTNIGDRLSNLQFAVDSFLLLPKTQVLSVSEVYETEPVGAVTDQPKFLNAVLLIETDLSPLTVLGACLGIEAAAGRKRLVKDGPRVLDLDLLFYENVKSETAELTLPHPRIMQRAFVLVPLNDLFPSGRAPGLSFGSAYKNADKSGVTPTNLKLQSKENIYG
ncbi:MAG: 2-amino-4-hydroxy-6-hydroxymethyldihydropteridine diphosphokinase [Clostridia bacterium]|nr:2-amino-4-hydroxy-6-hydroxymethyldihydropteridine diphosphokinase [Clostridia bacterium]MBQ7054582.1 2-amino-4-hydroxy-6-hydroxymethyldihydropteridine diphosphokinase [Oscillospiraceae bacterium]